MVKLSCFYFLIFFTEFTSEIPIKNHEKKEHFAITRENAYFKCKLCPLEKFCCENNCEICSSSPRSCWCKEKGKDFLVKKKPILNRRKSMSIDGTPHRYYDILRQSLNLPKKRLVVAGGHSKTIIKAVHEVHEMELIDTILVGDKEKILKIAKELDIDPNEFKIINELDSVKSTIVALNLIKERKADMYMKGKIPAKIFLNSIIDKNYDLQKAKRFSSTCVFELETVDHLLFVADYGFIPSPKLKDKIEIINNTVEVAKACGVKSPKVAPLASVEVINKKMPPTVDAAELKKLNENGEIKGCIIDGPLSFDLAVDPESAIHKKATDRKIVGNADILIFPDLNAGNILVKFLMRFTKSKVGCVVTGSKIPIIFNSRSDSFETKVNSIILAFAMSEKLNEI